MTSKVIPENYKSVQGANGLWGIMKVLKSGKTEQVVPCFNDMAIAAYSYKKIWILTSPANAGPGEMELTNFNGKTVFDGAVYDVKFGDDCMYVQTLNKNGGITWLLLDGNLNVIRDVGAVDFRPSCGDIVPDKFFLSAASTLKGSLQVVGANGVSYRLELKSGELSEIPKYVPRSAKTVVADVPAEYYNITISSWNESIKVQPKGKQDESTVATIHNIANYENLFTMMLGVNPEKKTRDKAVGRHSEKENLIIYRDVPRREAQAFVSLVKSVKSKDDATAIVVTSAYLKANGFGVARGAEFAEAMLKEMYDGFTEIDKDKENGRSYMAKAFKIGKDIAFMIWRTDHKRIICSMTPANQTGVLSEEDLEYLESVNPTKGAIIKLSINSNCRKLDVGNKPVPSQFMPNSILNDKEAKGRIKEFSYKYKNGYVLKASVVGDTSGREITLKALVFDGFTYVPKRKTTDKNIVYSSTTEDMFIKLF